VDVPAFFANVPVGDQVEIYLELLLALGLGAAVGIEREFRGHEAGLRTTSLVVLGAAMFGEVSTLYGDSRIAAGVVQGIGFLGAGLIFTRGANVRNATTATTMWAMAGVGLAVAEGFWLVAVLVTASIILMLELAPVSDLIYRSGRAMKAHHAPAAKERDARQGHPQDDDEHYSDDDDDEDADRSPP
jgi:putative Mg2+ transporter-C (MgtC) family protein